MNCRSTIGVAFWLLITSIIHAQSLGNAAYLPYRLELKEVTQTSLPGLHSFAFGQTDRYWIAVGGRINGLHGFFIPTGFPDDKANVNIWLMQAKTGKTLQIPVENLDVPFKDALKATNPQYVQDGKMLYICGGYGRDFSNNQMITFPVLTAIDLPLLVARIEAAQNPSVAIRQINDSRIQVCGGEMDKLNDYYYLVGGHNFSGLYNQNGPPQFKQQYTNAIKKFKITDNGLKLSIEDYTQHTDAANLHRRDFTLAPIIRPNGKAALCLYGGVFRPEADLPYYNPVYISEEQIVAPDNSYAQLFSQYTCPVIPMFDSTDNSMYSLFFAGLSAHFWDNKTNSIKYDEKVPFIRDISTFQRKSNGASIEYLMPDTFDEFLGTNMIFVLNKDIPHYTNEVIKLHAMKGYTLVGWLYGGIRAEIPNFTPSQANNRIFEVYITPKARNVTHTEEHFNTSNEAAQIHPNPFYEGEQAWISGLKEGTAIRIVNAFGQVVYSGAYHAGDTHRVLQELTAGAYWLISGRRFSKFFVFK